MSASGINFEIKTVADLRAAKSVEQELQRMIVAARAAGKDVTNLQNQLKVVQSAIAQKGFLGRALSETLNMAEQIPVVGSAMRALNGAVGMVSAGMMVLGAAAIVVRTGLQKWSEIENVQTTFTTLLGSMSAAKSRMKELQQFAAETPFELPEVAKASSTLENLTGGALSTGKGLRMVGDVAAAVNAPFEEVATTLGRLYQGMRDGSPVGMLTLRMTQLTGINLSQAKSWSEVTDALARYNGEMKRRSETLSGKKSNFGDAFGMMMAQIGRPLAPAVKGSLSLAASAMEGIGGALSRAWDRRDIEAEVLKSIREGTALVDAAKPSVQGLATVMESAEDRAARMGKEIAAALAPLTAMAQEAEKTAAAIDLIAQANEKMDLSKVDAAVASGTMSQSEGNLKKNSLHTAYALAANDRATQAAQAQLDQAQSLAAPAREKAGWAAANAALNPSEKTKREAQDAQDIQKDLDAAVAQAQARLDALKMARATIENERDTQNARTNAADAKAATEAAAADAKTANARALLDLEIQIANARAKGDKDSAEAAQRKLDWLRAYWSVWDQFKDDTLARDAANSAISSPLEKAATAARPNADRLAQIGGFVGGASRADRTAEETAKATRDTAKNTERIVSAITNPTRPKDTGAAF